MRGIIDGYAAVAKAFLRHQDRRWKHIHLFGKTLDESVQEQPLDPLAMIRACRRVDSKVADVRHASETHDGIQRAAATEDSWFCKESRPDEVVQNDFRASFLRRLSNEKVWVPEAMRPPKHQTVIIFDWDDTLLCTSFLNEHEGQISDVERRLQALGSAAKSLLEMAKQLGNVFIITNAVDGWVEFTTQTYMLSLLPILEDIQIISARERYEERHPNDLSMWKALTFLDVQRQMKSQVLTNLVSLGDSDFEMDAAELMKKEFAEAYVKTIKFQERPTLADLILQLKIVGQKLKGIVEAARNLKITLEHKTS